MMCRSDPSFAALNKVLAATDQNPFAPPAVNPAAALAEFQRLQIYDYNRLRFHPFGLPYGLAGTFPDTGQYGFSPFVRFDPRTARFATEEPKPQHSYIGLIAMAILSCPEKKMVLSDIYQYILDQYPYFRNRGPGWRNSIRHNLSLNDCFIKAGRSANGKGHYWAIHPANIEDFKKGDFRRRKAQRKVRKHMGLSVPDDDDSPAPTPPPRPPLEVTAPLVDPQRHHKMLQSPPHPVKLTIARQKRQFDMESILAPDPSPSTDSPRLTECESPRRGAFSHSPGSESPKDILPPNYFQAPGVAPPARRAMQWTVSLPLQSVGVPQRLNTFGPYVGSTPCWSSAASLLTYSVSGRGANSSEVSPCSSTPMQSPLVHRWQESINRVMDADNKLEH
ncbi:fork head domain-containing protein FD5 [Parasteatoda tepidariorum]|uniref:Forkhead box Q2 n=1 Tax=Parasteatoda tepidariorum TaxID=114398 RepID=A0A6C0W759_PARTP|nr:fork head domain-containing protein FD5-like [Parasteatoda tepidariorum]QIC35031.1 forkhead box Q2 [Parasteatoda tepidariorum]